LFVKDKDDYESTVRSVCQEFLLRRNVTLTHDNVENAYNEWFAKLPTLAKIKEINEHKFLTNHL